MARQNDIIKLKGTIGVLPFTKPKTGILPVKKEASMRKELQQILHSKEPVKMELILGEQVKRSEQLVGFDFKITGKLGTTLFVPFVGTIDRAAGEISVVADSFVPANMVGKSKAHFLYSRRRIRFTEAV